MDQGSNLAQLRREIRVKATRASLRETFAEHTSLSLQTIPQCVVRSPSDELEPESTCPRYESRAYRLEVTMDAHVLHIGADDCHRVAVLRSVGYQVDECLSLPQFASALEGEKGVDAVFLTESDGLSHEQAIQLARRRSAPVVLFLRSHDGIPARQADLAVEPLTSPSKWLRDVGALVEWSRGVRAQTRPVPELPRLLEMHKFRHLGRSPRAGADASTLLDFGDWRTLRS